MTNNLSQPAPLRPMNMHGIRTQTEVTAILGITTAAVWQGEQRALRKMRQHPVMVQLAMDYELVAGRLADGGHEYIPCVALGDKKGTHMNPNDHRLIQRFLDQVEGKTHDGDLAVAMITDMKNNRVIIDFGKSVSWVALDAKDCINLAKKLIKRARQISDEPFSIEI